MENVKIMPCGPNELEASQIIDMTFLAQVGVGRSGQLMTKAHTRKAPKKPESCALATHA